MTSKITAAQRINEAAERINECGNFAAARAFAEFLDQLAELVALADGPIARSALAKLVEGVATFAAAEDGRHRATRPHCRSVAR